MSTLIVIGWLLAAFWASGFLVFTAALASLAWTAVPGARPDWLDWVVAALWPVFAAHTLAVAGWRKVTGRHPAPPW